MNQRAKELIEHFQMKMLPEEFTYLRELYRSSQRTAEGLATVTTTYGVYCTDPLSHSLFHVLTRDEVWSFYEGDPIELYLLYPDGSSRTVTLGRDFSAGQVYQFTIPAGVWQGGCLRSGGEYALYGCTVAPGFTPDCFTAGKAADLIARYPDQAEIIRKLTSAEGGKVMQ
ncbi:MAG: cupin domain-containing protein [Oscillibacter sp.]|jgi:predicted cupin superfamily sugar epimerase|nr:cupin domain-containing protein [Oscillibacter sp.]